MATDMVAVVFERNTARYCNRHRKNQAGISVRGSQNQRGKPGHGPRTPMAGARDWKKKDTNGSLELSSRWFLPTLPLCFLYSSSSGLFVLFGNVSGGLPSKLDLAVSRLCRPTMRTGWVGREPMFALLVGIHTSGAYFTKSSIA